MNKLITLLKQVEVLEVVLVFIRNGLFSGLVGLPETGLFHLNTLLSYICLLPVELYIIIFQGEVQMDNEIPQSKGGSCGGMRTD